MTPRRKVGRNEKCPCGSGKKFKDCCVAAMTYGAYRTSRVRLVALVSIVAAAILFGIASVARNGNSAGLGHRKSGRRSTGTTTPSRSHASRQEA